MRNLRLVKNSVFTQVALGVWFAMVPLSHVHADEGASATKANSAHIPRPMITRLARTESAITLGAGIHYFEDVDLQEADSFDGYTVDLELVVPFLHRFQVWLYAPVYTEGEAKLRSASHQEIDIRGNTGVTDFYSARLEYQFMNQSDNGFNMAVNGGVGTVIYGLETSIDDVYNHQGDVFLLGLKFDKDMNRTTTLAANLGIRYYWVSDDINPGGLSTSDEFVLVDMSAAAVFHPWKQPIFPAVELVYAGDFVDSNSLLLIPELMVALWSHVDLRAGLPVGLTSDGEQIGARAQVSVHF
jgi:hypothetical protein